MNPNIKANSPEELISKLDQGNKLIWKNIPASSKERDERRVMGAFLSAAARSPLVSYPICVFHTSKENPDFRVVLSGNAVGVEVSRITNSTLEHVRRLSARKEIKGVLCTTSLFAETVKSKKELIDDCVILPQFTTGPSLEEEDAFWLKSIVGVIDRKTRALNRSDFHHYDETWLLLWDRLSLQGDIDRRLELLRSYTPVCWGLPNSFSKLIIAADALDEFVLMLGHAGRFS